MTTRTRRNIARIADIFKEDRLSLCRLKVEQMGIPKTIAQQSLCTKMFLLSHPATLNRHFAFLKLTSLKNTERSEFFNKL